MRAAPSPPPTQESSLVSSWGKWQPRAQVGIGTLGPRGSRDFFESGSCPKLPTREEVLLERSAATFKHEQQPGLMRSDSGYFDPRKRHPIPGFSGHQPLVQLGLAEPTGYGHKPPTPPRQTGYSSKEHLFPVPGFSGCQPGSHVPGRFGTTELSLQLMSSEGRRFPGNDVPKRDIPQCDRRYTGLSKRTPTGNFFHSDNAAFNMAPRTLPPVDRHRSGISKRTPGGGFFVPNQSLTQEGTARILPPRSSLFRQRNATGGFYSSGVDGFYLPGRDGFYSPEKDVVAKAIDFGKKAEEARNPSPVRAGAPAESISHSYDIAPPPYQGSVTRSLSPAAHRAPSMARS